MAFRRTTAITNWFGPALCVLVAGCAELRLPLIDSQPKPQVPTNATALWSDTILYQPGQPGVRGFGGRVMFYNDESKEPIAIDGTVTVYAFNNADPDKPPTVPERKFVFTPDQLPGHYSKSKLGHSYSFWLPWNKVGGSPEQLSLMLRFDGRKGGTLITENSRQYLPGVSSEVAEDTSTSQTAPNKSPSTHSRRNRSVAYVEPAGPDDSGNIAQVGHHVSEGQSAEADTPQNTSSQPSRMSTITIDVPPGFARRHLTGNTPPAISTEQPAGGGHTGSPSTRTMTPTSRQPDRSIPAPINGATGQQTGQQTTVVTPANATAFSTASSGLWGSAIASRSSRYGRSRFPVQRERAFGPVGDPVRRQPHRARWPSALPPIPRSSPYAQWYQETPDTAPVQN